MRYLLEQMPGVFFELYLLFIFSPEEKIKRQKSAAEQSWEMLGSQSCLPAWPLATLASSAIHSVVAFSTSAKAKVRERECVPSLPATVGPGENLPLKYQCRHISAGHI